MTGIGIRNKIVLLTVSMVVLAGVLSAIAALLLTRHLSDSYDQALRDEMEARAMTVSATAGVFLDVLGPEGLSAIEAILESADEEPAPADGSSSVVQALRAISSFEVWVRDESVSGGYSLLLRQSVGDTDAASSSRDVVAGLLAESESGGGIAASTDEQAGLIFSAAPIELSDGTTAIGVATFSAEERFSFLAQQRETATRLGLLLAAGIVGFTALVGGGVSLFVSRDITSRRRAEEELRESEERFRSTLDGMLEGGQVIGRDYRYLYLNDAAAGHGRRSKEDLLGHTMMEMYPGIEETEVFAQIRRCMERRVPHRMRNYFTYPDGSKAWFELSIQPVPEGVFVLSLDITERKRAEEAQDRLTAILEATPDFVSIVDSERRPVYLNFAGRKMIGLGPDEDISGVEIFGSLSEPWRKVMEEEAFPAVLSEGKWSGEPTLMASDGREIPISMVLLGHRSAEGRTEYISTISRDITERKRTEEAWRERARRDPLTGVLNHGAIVEELHHLLARNGAGAPCAVAMVDVDGLKAVNDSYGHSVGDAVLVATAQTLTREEALVGRYGGDEFVVVLPGADRAAAEGYRDGVLDALACHAVTDPETGDSVHARASVGLALYPHDADTVGDLIRFSDSAMYGAKRQRPIAAGQKDAGPPLRSDKAAEMVSQVLSLLTSEGGLDNRLSLVARHVAAGAGYDAVNIDVFSMPGEFPSNRNVHAEVPDDVVEAWLAERRQGVDDPFAEALLRTRRGLIVEDPQNDERLTEGQRAVLRAAELKSAAVVPLFWEEQLIGILSAASKREAAFSAADVQFLTAVATQIAAIVRMATLVEDVQSSSERLSEARSETVMLLAASAEAHDHTTGLHLKSVRALTHRLALELGRNEKEAQELALASVLHDIGKVRVPDAILSSTGQLVSEEWDLMKHHATWGEQFLARRPGLELAAVVARSHHERWDGSGYPDGLAGDAIPEAATIVAVSDSFDAMTSDRSYRATLSADDAVKEIVACSGTQFSPGVAAALQRLHERDALPVRPSQEVTREAAA